MRPEEPVANRPSTYLEALSMLDAVVAERDELRQRVSRLKRLMRRLVSEWLIRKAVKDGDLAAASIGTKHARRARLHPSEGKPMIGRHIDRVVDASIVGIGMLANWLIERLAPRDEQDARRYLAMTSAADALAEREAQCDVCEPDPVWAAEHMQPDEIDEPVGEYPDLPAQSQTAGQTASVAAVANLLSEEMNYLYLSGNWDFTAWASHIAPEIVRAIDRARGR